MQLVLRFFKSSSKQVNNIVSNKNRASEVLLLRELFFISKCCIFELRQFLLIQKKKKTFKINYIQSTLLESTEVTKRLMEWTNSFIRVNGILDVYYSYD